MKTKIFRNIFLIAAIIMFMSTSLINAQTEIKPDPSFNYEQIETHSSDDVVKQPEIQISVHKTKIHFGLPLYEGICELTVCDIGGRILYFNRIDSKFNSEFELGLNLKSSELVIVSVNGERTRKSLKFFIS